MSASKILFLDIDGVLNRHGETTSTATGFVDPACVAAFNRIVAACDPKIVICSAWRYLVHNGYMTVRGLATMLRTHGVQGDVIDVTRESRDVQPEGWLSTGGIDEPRWRQIADWLKKPLVQVASYCIIDDAGHAFGGRPGVRPVNGLTAEDAETAIEVLN